MPRSGLPAPTRSPARPRPDAITALASFDGISYAKGASVLRQLIAHIGDDAFVAGVAAYLRDHAFGNGELAEFVAAMEHASGRDLDDWVRGWLLTAGADTIAVEPGGVLTRRTPADHPADRSHTLDVAGFTGGDEVFRVGATIAGARTEVPALAAAPAASIVVPNAADLTWATVTLAPATIDALVDGLADVPDSTAREVLWTSLLGGVFRAEVDPRTLLDVVAAAFPREDDDTILTQVGRMVIDRVIPWFLPPPEQDAATARVAEAAEARLATATPATGVALVAARVVARTTADERRLRAWIAGEGLPVGIEGDDDFRWLLVRNLAERGLLGADEIEERRAADPTLTGHLAALGARAALPTPEAKAAAWRSLAEERTLSNYEALAVAGGFWAARDAGLVRPYAARYPDAVASMAQWMSDDALERVAMVAFPAALVEPETAEIAARALARDDLTPGVRHSIVDADHRLREALASRERFG